MIELLRRPEGATVEQIAEVTGWQKHTIRGAIAGALKKKLGLNVEATRIREVGPNKVGAKGSSTVYRIVGYARSAHQSSPTPPRPRPRRLLSRRCLLATSSTVAAGAAPDQTQRQKPKCRTTA